MRICFLVICAPYKPWNDLIRKCAKETWLSELKAQHLAFTYIGRPMGPVRHKLHNGLLKSTYSSFLWRKRLLPLPHAYFSDSSNISVELTEAWDTMTRKFLAAVALVHEVFDYDFIVKVNTTTYVNVLELEKELSKFEGTTYWGGAVDKEKPFTGGWATVLSRDLVENLLEVLRYPQKSPTAKKFEDEALGNLINLIGVKPKPMKFISVSREDELEIPSLDGLPFIRVKSTDERLTVEPKLFESLHRRIKSA